MAKTTRSLIDPLLLTSEYINRDPVGKPFKIDFWKKFKLLNFIFNIVVPLFALIVVAFILKSKYLAKRKNTGLPKFDQMSVK